MHFLERVQERVEGEAEDLVLSLYHQPAALRAVLERLELPAAVERVALSLDPADAGPWAVVTRAGAFVTCLGADMSPGTAHRIGHARLLVHRERLERDRAHLQRALALTAGQSLFDALGERMTAGPLAREELQALEAVAPLISGPLAAHFFRELLTFKRRVRDLQGQTLSRRRHGERLRTLWRGYEVCGHLLLLLGSHFTPTLRTHLETMPIALSSLSVLLAPRDLGMLLRMVRFLACHGKAVLAPCKRLLSYGASVPLFLLGHFGVLAVGARHQKARAEVEKLWKRIPQLMAGWSPDLGMLPSRLYSSQSWQQATYGLVAPEEASALADEFLQGFREADGSVVNHHPAIYRPPQEVDTQTAFALHTVMPQMTSREASMETEAGFWELVHLLFAKAALAEPADFCVPFDCLAPPGQRSSPEFEIEAGERIAKAAMDHILPAAPRTVQQRTGRNEPCPCGSGVKHKRCCLPKVERDPERQAAETSSKIEQALRQEAQQRREAIERAKQELASSTTPDAP